MEPGKVIINPEEYNQSLSVADKEFLVLLGPSGCGKTTTMRMIAGLEEPTSVEVWIGDQVVNDDLPKDLDVAMVFQNYGLYPHMTIRDNIAYPLKVRGTPKVFLMDEPCPIWMPSYGLLCVRNSNICLANYRSLPCM